MLTVTNSIIKFVASLSQKKYRDKEGCFVAEGTKCVRDTWDYFNCRMIIATQNWYETFGTSSHLGKIHIATRAQMQKMSQFTNPSEVIAVYDIPEITVDHNEVENGLNIVLDGVQDPGNLGTIIRLADWYGIMYIFCSKVTVDVYNHKVIQATMGAISRVRVVYCDLEELFEQHQAMPVYGTTLDGENIYNAKLSTKSFVVFGNEGNGMSEKLKAAATNNLFIPSGFKTGEHSESLNVGLAAAITISEFRREELK
ncbi:MAG: TrmH family RNA methyltransferase [Muribaculaceae bacterium]